MSQDVIAVIMAQLRRQPARVLTMLLGVLVATSGFTLLTGGVQTSRLQVSGAVDEHFRAAYDILVRPAGSRSDLEVERGLVRPNFLSGQFGGITFDQFERIAAMPGVEVAAPVGMVGYVPVVMTVEIDMTEHIDQSLDQQLLRVRHTWHTDRGLSSIEDPGDHYVYLTRNEILWPVYELTEFGSYRFADYRLDGERIVLDTTACGREPLHWPPAEVLPDGSVSLICDFPSEWLGQAGLTEQERTRFEVWHLREDGRFEGWEHYLFRQPSDTPIPMDRLTIGVQWPVMLLLAAIDPVAEARLVGLDEAITAGRYLAPDDEPQRRGSRVLGSENFDPRADIPMILSGTAQVDEQLTSTIEAIDPLDPSATLPLADMTDQLASLPGEPRAAATWDIEDNYRQLLDNETGEQLINFNRIFRTGQPDYVNSEAGALLPAPVPADLDPLWAQEQTGAIVAPLFTTDVGFRPLDRLREPPFPRISVGQVVGTFDPTGLAEFSPLSQVPLETYQPARAAGADESSRSLLGDRPLRPNSHPGGYLATPPQLLTTFASLSEFVHPGEPSRRAPISAIRLRVDDEIAGLDPRSQEQLRQLAEQIALDTGLDVDLTLGSSPGPQTVTLPAGDYGRPDLQLTEGWSVKGLAVALVHEADRKSLLLLVLILAACGLFLANAVAASVRVRRRELAILSCLGWPRHRITGLVLGEVLLTASAAGVLATAATFPLAAATGIRVTTGHALLAIPVALALALAAAIIPARNATTAWPYTALQPPVHTSQRPRRTRTLPGMAIANLTRVPARSLIAGLALAVGVAATTTLLLITTHFHGQAQGTLLGDFVSLQVRGIDLAAAVTTAALGILAITDALYLNIRQRAPELAALRATGWSDSELARLNTYEGAALATTAAVLGAVGGLGLVSWFTATVTTATITTTAVVAAAAAALATLAAAIPAQLTRTLPLTTHLVEE